MTADDIFGPETDEEKDEAEGHPLLLILDRHVISMLDFDKFIDMLIGEK